MTVTLSADPERTVAIPVTTTNQGGASSADYSGVPTSVTFDAGDTSKTFDFAATDDTEDDDEESVRLGFGSSLPAGVSEGSPSETTVSITDDDDPQVTVSFGASTYTAAEGGTATVTVTLSADPERTVAIPVTTTNQGGATSADYSGVPASVTFDAGDTSKTFDFAGTADTEDDDGESVRLGFGSSLPAGVSEGSPSETTVSITDDDDPQVTVSFGASTYTAAEGGTATVTVTLSADPERTVAIPVTTTNQGGATSADYSGVPASVTFDAGDTSKTFTFTAAQDTLDDDGESVKLAFGTSLPAGVSEGSPSETTVSITDDDDPQVTVSFGAATYTAAEGGTATVTLTLSADPERTVEVRITATNQGGATSADYSGVPASVTFDAGDTSQTFDFAATQDTADDDGESVLLAFGSSLPAGVSAGSPSETTVSITDDDDPQVTVSFGAATYTAAEGGTATVTVTLSADPERTVEVPITKTNERGVSDSDYSGVPASITFNSGDTEKTITFTATADSLNESGERVKLSFGTLPAGVSEGTPAETTVTISDSTQAQTTLPTIHFGSASYTVSEGGSVDVTVTLSKAPGSEAVIPLTASNQGGATASDYSGVPTSVTFGAAETSKTFTVTAAQDTVDDDGESILLGFGTLPGGITATTGQAAATTVSITDDDDPAVTVSFGAATYTAAEGGTATVTVTLSADPERTVAIPVTTTNQGGATSADYSGVPASVTFDAGDTSQPITFAATQDAEDDDGESVKLAFGALPTGVTAGATDETTVSITDNDDPDVTVSFGAATYTAAEGGTATVTVTLSADPERTVAIPVTTTNQGGASAADYSGVPASVTFDAGDTSKTFDFAATADTADDDGESVKLGFGSSLPAGVSAGSPSKTTVSITDDDDPAVTVSFGAATYTAAEGGTATVTVTLSADPERTVAIPVTTTNQGGATSADYSGVPASVTFDAGDTSQPITFAATQDAEDDDGESVKLAFGALPTGVSAGATDETTVSITDDDDPQVTVSFGASTYTAAEGGTATVTVTLSADPERTVAIPVTTTNQGGASSADYSGVPTSVTFDAGDTSKTFDFAATQDAEDDDGESVKLAFGALPTGVTAGATDETTVSITDNDDPDVTVSFGAATYTAAEGGTATVTVTLSADPERTVAIPVTTTNQGGASAADYSGVPATVTFDAGDTSKTFDFAATADTEDDDGESVKLAFGSSLPAGVSAGSPSETTVSITDDDDPAVTVSFGAATYTAAEGGTATVTVTLSADPERTVAIPVTTANQGGASSADYSGVPASVTFDAGDTSKTFTFTAAQDTLDDDGESVKLGFGSSLPAGVSEGSPSETTVSIRDDDDPQVTVSFGASTYTAAEGGTATVTVTLSADPERTVEVQITTTNQGGASSADYSGVPSSVTFKAGETSKTFDFAATADTEDDDGESVLLGFGSSLPAGVSAGSPSETTVSITDDDDPQVTVSFGASTYTAAEGGTATVTVTLSADPERTVAIPVTTTNQGGATSADYSGVPASVTFDAGDTSQPITFAATQDAEDDDGESVKLAFGALPTGVSAGATDETTVSITDDDDPQVTVSFGASTYTAAEGGTATVTVTLSADPERTVAIPVTTTNQGGASAADYSGVPASVTFDAGDTSKTFTFSAAQDTLDDDGESVKLAFGALPAGVRAGSPRETTVSITDDDDPAVTVSFGAATYTAAEGGTATVTVTLSADPERTVAIPVTTTNQGGATSADYSGVPATVTFDAGDTSKTFDFAATQDAEDDDGESVKLAFGALPTGVRAGATDETSVSISDDDDLAVTVSFGASTYTAAEGGTATVTVTLSADPERTVAIPLTKTEQGGATSADYSGVPASVTFDAGDTSKTFDFAATQDAEDDDGESVKLAFGALPTGVSAGATDETSVSIRDDDDPQVTVSFGAATYRAIEGSTAAVTVELSADPERTVAVPITKTNERGVSDSDYSGVPASITFNSGDTEKTITFTATADSLNESGERVKLSFGTLPARVSEGTPAETTVTISDSTQAQTTLPTIHFGSASYTVSEGGSVDVTVTLSKAPGSEAVIPLTASNQGGATASDYSGVPTSVTFGAAETSKTFTVTAAQDTVDDDGESILLGFGTLPGGITATTGQAAATTVSITDDDDPQVTVSFGAATYTAAEGGTATVTVTLSADPERTVAIPVTTTNQGGASAADYSGVPATVTFDAGDTSKTFTFSATQDAEDDDGESVKLAFGALPTGVTAGATDETTVSITDNDDPDVTVQFGASTYTAAEGGTATVTVELSADPERTVEVQITMTNQGGASSADYSGVPATVTFNAGDTSKTFDFAATADTVDDGGESVLLAFGALPTGVTAGATDETTVSITDDDPAVTVQFGASTYTAAEGGTATVTVELSADPERTVAVPVTKTNQGGAGAADYSGVPATVTFNSGDTSKTFTFTATQDMGDDDGESVKLAFGKLPSGVSMGSPSETTVTIRQVSTEFILSCSLAVWCADMRFSDGTAVDWGWSRLRYEKDWDPPATVSDDTFTFRGVEYTLRRVDVHPGTYPIMPNAWSRTKQGYSYISLRIARGDYWDPPPREHYRDWVLHLDGLELPFKDAFRAGDEFQWIGVAFQELFNDWTSSTVTKIGIEEVAATAQEPTPAVPYTPIHVEAFAAGRNALYVRWDPPWWRVGVPDATGYIVQWKEAADSWSDSAAVSQREVRGGWQGLQQLDGLTEGVLYSVRVFATNAAGAGPPSEDTLGRPQPLNPRLDSMSVNGRTLTMRYDRRLDGNSVPASTAFVVLVNGGLRTVDTVAVRGMEVVLTLAEGVSAANSVIARYEPPTDPAAAFLRDTEGNYVFTSKRDGLKEVANETPRSSLQPLTASFSNVPSSHDGIGSFTFNIGFSEPVWIGTGFPRAHLLVVTGGTVTSAHWLERRTDEWAVTIRPDGSGDIVITLPKDRYCVADLDDSIRQEDLVAGAPCAAGNRPLTNEPTATVTGTSSEQHDATENTPAEGAPRIDGDPAVGETLFAGTTGITDADGLNHAVFEYQWLADDAEIEGASGSTYTPTSADEGKTITVRVTFTDDAGNEESLTSAATAAVAAAGLELRSATLDGATLTLTYNETLDSSVTLPATAFTVSVNGGSRSVSAVSVSGSAVTLTLASEAAAGDTVTVDYTRPEGRHFIRDTRGRVAPSFSGRVVSNDTAPDQPEESEEQAEPLTASAHGVPASHDGSAAFTFELRFSEEMPLSYKTLRDHAFTVTGGEVVKARRLERGKNVRWEITVQPSGNADVTLSLPATTDCSGQGAICAGDGRKLSGALEIIVPGPPPLLLSRQEDSAATGAPTITGTARVGETLTANTTDIADSDGLTNATFTYQWLADEADITDATGATYTPAAADAGKAIKVRVSFTDDAGNAETLTSAATAAVIAANTTATGVPTISGTAQVGETLTADTTGIADSDGLTKATFAYQWLADDADITDATSATYTPAAADAGKAIKVQVSFTDDAGNAETLTSAATAAVIAANTTATGVPTISGTAQVGETLTADTTGIADSDGLTNATFTYQWLADEADIAGATGSTYTPAAADAGKAIKVRVSFTDDAGNTETLTSAATAAVIAANTTATGVPTITGTAQVGEALTANTTGIADSDGLTSATFTYQWLADDADISGATSSSYTPVAADAGKAIKVQVSFTDDQGHAESLTSAATSAVRAAVTLPPLTASAHDVPESHDGSAAFTFELRFSETPKDGFSYASLRDHAFTVTGAEVAKARRLETGKSLRWEITVEPSGNADVSIILPATSNCGGGGAICTQDGRVLSNRLVIIVSGSGG